jgi:hypothetical protein
VGDALQDANFEKVATEMALHFLAYNMTRVMKIKDIPAVIAAMKTKRVSFAFRLLHQNSNKHVIARTAPTMYQNRPVEGSAPR